MFEFLKKKKKNKYQQENTNEKSADKSALLKEIEEQIITLDDTVESEYYYNISKLYDQVDLDKSIEYLEKCLVSDKGFTKAQSELLKKYNIKRKELVSSGQIDQALEYLDKIDNVLQQSKDSVRGL